MKRDRQFPAARTSLLAGAGLVALVVLVTSAWQMNKNDSDQTGKRESRGSSTTETQARHKPTLGGLILSPVEGLSVSLGGVATAPGTAQSGVVLPPKEPTAPAAAPQDAVETTGVPATSANGQAGNRGADGRSDSAGSSRPATSTNPVTPAPPTPAPPPQGGLLDLLDPLLP